MRAWIRLPRDGSDSTTNCPPNSRSRSRISTLIPKGYFAQGSIQDMLLVSQNLVTSLTKREFQVGAGFGEPKHRKSETCRWKVW
jgi:hypothetical protein